MNLAPEFNIFIGRTPSPYVNRNKGKITWYRKTSNLSRGTEKNTSTKDLKFGGAA